MTAVQDPSEEDADPARRPSFHTEGIIKSRSRRVNRWATVLIGDGQGACARLRRGAADFWLRRGWTPWTRARRPHCDWPHIATALRHLLSDAGGSFDLFARRWLGADPL